MKAAFLALVAAAALLVSTNTADARPVHWHHGGGWGGYGHRYYGGWGGYGHRYYGGWGGYYPRYYYGGYYPSFWLGSGYGYNWPYYGTYGWGGWYW